MDFDPPQDAIIGTTFNIRTIAEHTGNIMAALQSGALTPDAVPVDTQIIFDQYHFMFAGSIAFTYSTAPGPGVLALHNVQECMRIMGNHFLNGAWDKIAAVFSERAELEHRITPPINPRKNAAEELKAQAHEDPALRVDLELDDRLQSLMERREANAYIYSALEITSSDDRDERRTIAGGIALQLNDIITRHKLTIDGPAGVYTPEICARPHIDILDDTLSIPTPYFTHAGREFTKKFVVALEKSRRLFADPATSPPPGPRPRRGGGYGGHTGYGGR